VYFLFLEFGWILRIIVLINNTLADYSGPKLADFGGLERASRDGLALLSDVGSKQLVQHSYIVRWQVGMICKERELVGDSGGFPGLKNETGGTRLGGSEFLDSHP